MEKRGVTCRKCEVDVVGACISDDGTICSSCNKIVLASQIVDKKLCPFCKKEISNRV